MYNFAQKTILFFCVFESLNFGQLDFTKNYEEKCIDKNNISWGENKMLRSFWQVVEMEWKRHSDLTEDPVAVVVVTGIGWVS